MNAGTGFLWKKFLSIKHQSMDFDLFFEKISVRAHNTLLVVLHIMPRRITRLTPFLLVLNTLQAEICRSATRTFTRNTAILKLTHCDVSLIMLIPRV